MDSITKEVTRLWTSSYPLVAAFVASAVRYQRDRDDVMQEIGLAIIESNSKYDPDRSFEAWAIGVARNQIRTHFASRKKDRLVFSDATIEALEAAFQQAAVSPKLDHRGPSLEQLNTRSRSICDLRYNSGLKPAAIAERLEMTANTVAKALQRIREQLRNCIEIKSAAEGAVE